MALIPSLRLEKGKEEKWQRGQQWKQRNTEPGTGKLSRVAVVTAHK